MVEPSDPGVFEVDGDLFLDAVSPWRDGLLVIGVVQRADGTSSEMAWLTDNGVDWERRALTFPDGCGSPGGIVGDGDRLVVSCQFDESGPRVGMASTTDLTNWQTEPVSDVGVWFGAQLGAGPTASSLRRSRELQATRHAGAIMRIWSTGPSDGTRERVGATPRPSSTRASSASILSATQLSPAAWSTNGPRKQDPDVHAVQRPAIWISTDGDPFERFLLDPGGQSADGSGVVTGVTKTTDGYVAVGNAGGGGIAWTSDDLRTWSNTPPMPDVDERPTRSRWGVITLDDGSVLSAGDGRPNETLAWLSTDGGRTWQSPGQGPNQLVRWGDRVVGMSTYTVATAILGLGRRRVRRVPGAPSAASEAISTLDIYYRVSIECRHGEKATCRATGDDRRVLTVAGVGDAHHRGGGGGRETRVRDHA